MEQLWSTSHISGGNAAYVEELYDSYLYDPNAVPEEWRSYFDKLPRVEGVVTQDTPHSIVREHFELLGKNRARPLVAPGSGGVNIEHERKQVKVLPPFPKATRLRAPGRSTLVDRYFAAI